MITKINMINYEDKGGPQMSRLIEMIETAETIAVLGHIHPDGDCVGSCLAVCNYIREQYPEKVVQVYLEKPPVKFNYLKYFDEREWAVAEGCDPDEVEFVPPSEGEAADETTHPLEVAGLSEEENEPDA